MLATQVQYWSLQETKRSNLAREQLQSELQAETKRHNLQAEALGWSTLEETTRHNKATESIGYAQVALGWAQLGETQRHNMAYESETQRHNVATESVQSRQAETAWYSAQVGGLRAQYQNAYDSARTKSESELLPYRKWASVADTAAGFASALQGVTSAARNTTQVLSDVMSMWGMGQTSLFR